MMSLEYIEELAREAGVTAEEPGKEPYWLDDEWKKQHWPPFPFPFLGDYCPEGWELVDEFFCDSSGFGRDDEAALSGSQFLEKCEAGYGYAITQAGQFQVYVGQFRRM